MSFGFRNYRINMHLVTQDAQRATALRTSADLRKAISDPNSRDIIISALASAIFSPEPSGYIDNESAGPQESPTAIVAAVSSLLNRTPKA